VIDPNTAESRGVSAEIVRRHELGHCNGWSHSQEAHYDPRYLQAQEQLNAQTNSWIRSEEKAGRGVPLLAKKPILVADGGLDPVEAPRPAPPPRRARPYYPPPPPGVIFIPSEGRAMPCLPTLITLGLLRFCI